MKNKIIIIINKNTSSGCLRPRFCRARVISVRTSSFLSKAASTRARMSPTTCPSPGVPIVRDSDTHGCCFLELMQAEQWFFSRVNGGSSSQCFWVLTLSPQRSNPRHWAYEISLFLKGISGLGVRDFWFLIGISRDFLWVIYPSTQEVGCLKCRVSYIFSAQV